MRLSERPALAARGYRRCADDSARYMMRRGRLPEEDSRQFAPFSPSIRIHLWLAALADFTPTIRANLRASVAGT